MPVVTSTDGYRPSQTFIPKSVLFILKLHTPRPPRSRNTIPLVKHIYGYVASSMAKLQGRNKSGGKEGSGSLGTSEITREARGRGSSGALKTECFGNGQPKVGECRCLVQTVAIRYERAPRPDIPAPLEDRRH